MRSHLGPSIAPTDPHHRYIIHDDELGKIDARRLEGVQRVFGAILYHAHAFDNTILPALSYLAIKQANTTELTEKTVSQLLYYMSTKPDMKVYFYASGMILNIHSSASHLFEYCAHSRVAGHYLLGSVPKKDRLIVMNGVTYIFVAS